MNAICAQRHPITPVDGMSLTGVIAFVMTLNLDNPSDWDRPAFPLSVAAQASRMNVGAVRMWFERKKVALQPDDSPGTREAPARLLTWRSVLSLAVTAELIRGTGMDVGVAYGLARHWTTMPARESLDGNWYDAPPAGLFDGDRILTVFITWGGDAARIVPVGAGSNEPGVINPPIRGLSFDLLFPMRYPVHASPRLIVLNSLHRYAKGVCEGSLRSAEEVAR